MARRPATAPRLPARWPGRSDPGAESVDVANPLSADSHATILTVGHSNQSVEHLLDLLREHAVDVLVDVRSQPYSRYATQFNRESLEPTVTNAKLRYLFMGE